MSQLFESSQEFFNFLNQDLSVESAPLTLQSVLEYIRATLGLMYSQFFDIEDITGLLKNYPDMSLSEVLETAQAEAPDKIIYYFEGYEYLNDKHNYLDEVFDEWQWCFNEFARDYASIDSFISHLAQLGIQQEYISFSSTLDAVALLYSYIEYLDEQNPENITSAYEVQKLCEHIEELSSKENLSFNAVCERMQEFNCTLSASQPELFDEVHSAHTRAHSIEELAPHKSAEQTL